MTANLRAQAARAGRRIAFGVQRVEGGRLVGIPCIFGRKRDAVENLDTDEVLVRLSFSVDRVFGSGRR